MAPANGALPAAAVLEQLLPRSSGALPCVALLCVSSISSYTTRVPKLEQLRACIDLRRPSLRFGVDNKQS
ncbi:hypothetical protein E2562_012903 [Oryza meyeriana var. granulata]|uniref:Uncharacterized protein n=1 Tax=Oryza meyeriana var. granulata TaxID=110450 RepID=A0A6G1CFZ5_9ORYZ|nr:hypothetical protein E2562_012903 [Oryza meyeriana var. granulata]